MPNEKLIHKTGKIREGKVCPNFREERKTMDYKCLLVISDAALECNRHMVIVNQGQSGNTEA